MLKLWIIGMLVVSGGLWVDKCTVNAPRADIVVPSG